jgi:hypothetical protein
MKKLSYALFRWYVYAKVGDVFEVEIIKAKDRAKL